jgi:hypothetical protein
VEIDVHRRGGEHLDEEKSVDCADRIVSDVWLDHYIWQADAAGSGLQREAPSDHGVMPSVQHRRELKHEIGADRRMRLALFVGKYRAAVCKLEPPALALAPFEELHLFHEWMAFSVHANASWPFSGPYYIEAPNPPRSLVRNPETQ